jgi:hypothetical protein
VANRPNLYRQGAFGFINWLDRRGFHSLCVWCPGRDLLFARRQNQIEALTAGLQKVSEQLEATKPALQVVVNDQ